MNQEHNGILSCISCEQKLSFPLAQGLGEEFEQFPLLLQPLKVHAVLLTPWILMADIL